jgi:hypothetical protein
MTLLFLVSVLSFLVSALCFSFFGGGGCFGDPLVCDALISRFRHWATEVGTRAVVTHALVFW